MPSREGQVHEPNLVPPPLHPAQKVWVCRFTGALFASYEEYLKELAAYRQRVWSCKHSGKTNLCYEEALTEEARCQGLLEQFPACYERPVTKLVHHATLKMEDLCQRLVTYFKDRFVPGEVVLGRRNGVLTACRISSASDPTDLEHDSQALSSAAAVIPPDPEDEYSVEWLSDGVSQLLKRYELTRKTVPLTRAVMKSWLPSAAEAETVAGVKGIPCIWRVNDELQERHGLQSEIPDTLKERIERAQQRRAEQSTRRPSQVEQDFIQMDAGEIDDQDDEDYEESMSGKTGERKSDAKKTVPVEPLEKTRERLKEGTVKRVLFDVLEIAGEQGMSIQGLVEAVQAAGVKQWEGARSANSSIAATCTHDFAFVRVGPGQIALRALKHDTMQVSAPAAAARAQSEERVVARSPAFERNNFKCPKCHKSHHPDNSPLVLCDSCPRSYHLACLDLGFEELPEDEWQCPKCTDRKLGTGRRLAGSYSRSDVYERLPLGDLDKDDRALMRGLSRWERDRRRLDERSDKERARDEHRSLRERAREAAKWAALHPLDDLELLEDEEEALAAVELEAQAAAEEAERAAQRAEGKPEGALADRVARLQRRAKKASERAAALKLVIEGPPAVEPGVSAEASKTALYDALSIVDFLTIFGASFEAAPLSLLEVQQAAAFPLDTDHMSHLYIALLRCLLIEAMAMEGVVRSRAKRWGRVIDDSTWPEILRRYLFASRAGLPVPENLNDICEDVDTANMDDHTACIVGAKLMSEMPFHRLKAGLHLRILVALCNDVTECTTLRNEISARVEEMNQIQAEFRHKQNEDRKRQKEEAIKVVVPERPAEEPVQEAEVSQAAEEGGEAAKGNGQAGVEESREVNKAEDSGDTEKAAEGEKVEQLPGDPVGELQGEPKTTEERGQPSGEQPDEENGGPKAEGEGQMGDGETTDPIKPNFDLPEDLKEYKGSKRDKKEMQAWKARRSEEVERLAKEKGAWDRQQKERRRKRQKVSAGKKEAKAADAERDYGEELREREAALEEAMDARAIRGEMLGQDRHYRRYWWYPGEPSVIFVEEQEGTAVGTLDAPEQLEALMERLHQHGLREKLLFQNLVKRKDMILSSLGYHTVNLEVAAAPRPRPEADAEAVAMEMDKTAVQASVKKLCEFLDQLDDVPAAPVETSVEAWKARLAAVGTQEELGTAVLDLEADINCLGSGLPTGADDASLAGFGKSRRKWTANELGSKAGSAAADGELPHGKLDANEPPSKRVSETPEGATNVKTETQPTGEFVDVASEQVAAAAKPKPEAMAVDRPALPVENGGALDAHGSGPTAATVATLMARAPEVDPSMAALNGDGANGPITEEAEATADGGSALNHAVKMDVDVRLESNDRFDENLSATECVERLFKDSDYVMPFDYVNPPEELDASDSEASKNRRGGTLWRSARERKAWLKDARRGLHSRDASVVAYVAAVLVDRAQPLLRSLIRATKRAEKEAAEWEALEAAAAHQPSSTEGTPAPQTKAVKSAGNSERVSNAKGKRSRRSVDTGGKLTGRLSEGPVNKKPKTSAPKPAEDDDSEATISDDDHPAKPIDRWNSACQVCGEGGDLLRCEAPDCPVAEHVACAGLDDTPTTDWYCSEHRNKPSLKRKRARSAAKDAAAFVRRSAEPRPSPPRKSTGRAGKGATTENGTGKRGTTKRRR